MTVRPLLMVFLTLTILLRSPGAAVEYWVSGTDATVITNNDCGYVSAMHGQPVIVRSFHGAGSPGVKANVTDRIYTGDEVRVPSGGRIEVVSGSNVVFVLGEGGRVRFSGLRTFVAPNAREASRLDVELIQGEARIQVRLNEARPESVLAITGGTEFLLRRGDLALLHNIMWQGSVLAGEALVRIRRGGTTGAPFSLGEGFLLGMGGQGELGANAAQTARLRLPFSFELNRAALPPLPSLSYDLEAP